MGKNLNEIPFSFLDLANVIEGDRSAGDAFRRSVSFARHAEQLGYKRYWFAEHHNMQSVASSATAVLIGHIAGTTRTLRVGAGGIMLPNHAPLIIAEQFGTLASLYPGRIDLGLGRAPGTDQVTAYALRRNLQGGVDTFPNDVQELLQYLGPEEKQGKVQAIPGVGTRVPVWLLGSSTYSAQLAAKLGLPFGFAAHFAPAQLLAALSIYYNSFQPSEYLDRPYALACVNILAADTEEEANYLATSAYQMILGMVRNLRKPMPPPVRDMENRWSPEEQAAVFQMLHYSFIGTPETLSHQLGTFVEKTGVDEIMVATHIYDEKAKLKSMELTASLSSRMTRTAHTANDLV